MQRGLRAITLQGAIENRNRNPGAANDILEYINI